MSMVFVFASNRIADTLPCLIADRIRSRPQSLVERISDVVCRGRAHEVATRNAILSASGGSNPRRTTGRNRNRNGYELKSNHASSAFHDFEPAENRRRHGERV